MGILGTTVHISSKGTQMLFFWREKAVKHPGASAPVASEQASPAGLFAFYWLGIPSFFVQRSTKLKDRNHKKSNWTLVNWCQSKLCMKIFPMTLLLLSSRQACQFLSGELAPNGGLSTSQQQDVFASNSCCAFYSVRPVFFKQKKSAFQLFWGVDGVPRGPWPMF